MLLHPCITTAATKKHQARLIALHTQVSGGTQGPAKEQDRLRLKQMSEERASKWPNTLQVRHSAAGVWDGCLSVHGREAHQYPPLRVDTLLKLCVCILHRLQGHGKSVLARRRQQQRRLNGSRCAGAPATT